MITRVKLFEIIYATVVYGINTDQLTETDKLGSEEGLSDVFNTSRSELRNGLIMLEWDGIIKKHGHVKSVVSKEEVGTLLSIKKVEHIKHVSRLYQDYLENFDFNQIKKRQQIRTITKG